MRHDWWAELDDREEVAELVGGLLDAGRAAWPALALAAESFFAHVGRHVPRDASVRESLRAIHAADLFLACACAERVPGAMEAFSARHAREVDAALRGRRAEAVTRDDLRQVLWEKLFVGRPEAPPKIAGYSGRGPLGRWVRAAAVNTALNLCAAVPREELTPDGDPQRLGGNAPNPELHLLKARFQAELNRAFREVLASLEAEQRNVLRLHFLDGLSIDRIGAVYGVHRATAARWIARGREALLARTRRLLSERLRATEAELDSLMGVVQSQLELSLTALRSATRRR